jgi:hypothetical protein
VIGVQKGLRNGWKEMNDPDKKTRFSDEFEPSLSLVLSKEFV